VSKGAFYSSIKTTGAQSNVVVERVGRADAEDFASELRSLLTNRSQAPTRAPSQSAVDELERLAALRDRGVLTDLEFELQKAKILGS
jgi:Short C-terminal domain